jgi:hypothetical protein
MRTPLGCVRVCSRRFTSEMNRTNVRRPLGARENGQRRPNKTLHLRLMIQQFYAPREFDLVAFVADRFPYRTGGRGRRRRRRGKRAANPDCTSCAPGSGGPPPLAGGNRDSDNYWGTDWDRRRGKGKIQDQSGGQGRKDEIAASSVEQHITLLCPRADDTREPYRAPLRLGLRCLGTVLTPHLDWPPALSPFLGHDLRRCSSNMGVGGDDARGGNELPDIRASISGG